MNLVYDDGWVKQYCGDALVVLPQLEAECAQMVCTSPPYWGLRKYEGQQAMVWGGNPGCEHEWQVSSHIANKSGGPSLKQESNKGAWNPEGIESKHGTCQLCGAWRGSYGLEPTPEMYVEHTVEFLRAIRRVLRKDGVVFWNIGDSYNSIGGHTQAGGATSQRQGRSNLTAQMEVKGQKALGLKPKDLCLIPFRVALAAQADGWWVRSVIIWSKPNPMPESVEDRPTESHEYILMLVKDGTSVFSWIHPDGRASDKQPPPDHRWHKDGEERATPPEGWTLKNKMGWQRINLWEGIGYCWDQEAVREAGQDWGTRDRTNWRARIEPSVYGPTKPHTGCEKGDYAERGRNLRSVWEFPTQPFPEAHFAVFPRELARRCILAATSEVGNCSKCGKPWVRVIEPTPEYKESLARLRKVKNRFTRPAGDWHSQHAVDDNQTADYKTIGWKPQCSCNAPTVPAMVLDPFGGAGTTGEQAKSLGRKAILIDTSEEYCKLAVKRCMPVLPLATSAR